MTRRTSDRPTRRITPQALWIVAATLILLIGGTVTAMTWPAPVSAADAPTPSPTTVTEDQRENQRWIAINDALAAGDREAFLAQSTGTARDTLARWWDGTKAIGWDTAVMTPWDETIVYLGARLTHAPAPVRGDGTEDAGLALLQGGYYETTWQDGLIATITPYAQPKPWDESAIHAIAGAGVTVFGRADEAGLIDATLPVAERAAAAALAEVRALGGTVPVSGFLVAVTDDDAALARWQFGDGQVWDMEIAGFAMPTNRPAEAAPWIAPTVAVGPAHSGTITAVGPLSADERLDTLTHEFIHVLHHAATASATDAAPVSVAEGLANWVTSRALDTRASFDYPDVRDAVATRGVDAFSDEQMRDADAWIGYAAAESFYAYIAAAGGDPWALAVSAENSGESLPAAALRQNAAFTADAWAAWVAQY